MSTATLLVNSLLEDDESKDANIDKSNDDVDPTSYLNTIADERKSGKLTVYNADDYHHFYHRTLTYKDGVTPIQCRRNGKTKRWKTRPAEFQIPVKYGLKECFYITPANADEWSTVPLPQKAKPQPRKKQPRASLPANMIPPAAALPERPAPVATLSPSQYAQWEREQAAKVSKPPPSDHPELPL
jgi:hypothetical protein